MNLLEAIRIALSQIWVNRMRSILTLLGMLIGVGSVVGIVSISEGMRRTVIDEFGQLGGANLIRIMPLSYIIKDGRYVPVDRFTPMSLDDAVVVEGVSDALEAVLPRLETGAEIRHGKAGSNVRVQATLPVYARVYNWDVAEGRFLSARDLQQWRSVCVLGEEIGRELFGRRSPLGREVKLRGRRYTVVGVMEERKGIGRDWGKQVLVPVSTAQRRIFGHKTISGLDVFARDPADVPQMIPAIEKALEQRHGPDAQYRIISNKGFLEQIEQVILVMKLVTGGIAGISLLVGGIGIMNIMLVSVTERTREIGIRKALGARPATLLLQFVVEAVALSLCGGLMGVALGVGVGFGISQIIEHFAESPFPSVVSLDAVLFALGVSVSIGLFFGIFPAARASRLDPVEALSYE